jgi:hydrogenase maturation protein HypF
VAREPRRSALGLLYAAYGEAAFDMTELAPVAAFRPDEREVLRRMLERGVNAPLTSSVGRFFDAIAAICGLRQRTSYEGEAAAALEWSADAVAADDADAGLRYDFPLHDDRGQPGLLAVDWRPALHGALADLRRGAPPGTISTALHAGLAGAITAVAGYLGHRRVVLSGGCFQNIRLTQAAVADLRAAGFAPAWHREVPPNDGGLALGQAAWVAWMERRGETACV